MAHWNVFSLRAFESSRRLFSALALALMIPLFVSDDGAGGVHVGLPRIFSGDEPHYLVMVNSLVDDGDLDLRNDYDAARSGELRAGRNFAGRPLDHQIVWYTENGVRWPWGRVYELPPDGASREQGASPPRHIPGAPDFRTQPEYSAHPPGLAFLVAPLVAPLRKTPLVEPTVLLVTALITFVTAVFTRRLFRVFSDDTGVVNVATLLTILGTPLWAYSRALFTEPWLACCSVGAAALALGSDAYALAGALVAIGMLMKPPFALVGVPLLVDTIVRRDLRRSVALALPMTVGAAAVLGLNAHFFGSPFRAPQPWETGSVVGGPLGLLFSWNHGLFLFAPAAIVALLGWPSLFRTHARQAWILATTVAAYWLLMGLWRDWRGGYCYGPRLIVPLIPCFFAGIVPAIDRARTGGLWTRRATIVLCAFSGILSAIGAVATFQFYGRHPLLTPLMLALHIGP
jgi:hypothetical protein